MKKFAVLPTLLASKLATHPNDVRWLIDELWRDEAVGIIGGEPKSYKSFLALAMAVAVASGTQCLGQFPATRGRVLVYAAEDALHDVRARLAGIAAASNVNFDTMDVHVITAPSVRLDLASDCAALERTIAALKPKLLVLDPFVRLHRIDENKSGEVAPLLSYLRELQRKHHLAIALVHHAKKGGKNLRGGQALRGSSEFHAWGDSNLYMRRDGEGELVNLTVEHRSAKSIAKIMLYPEPVKGSKIPSIALALLKDLPPPPIATNVKEQIAVALQDVADGHTSVELRKMLRVRNAKLVKALAELSKEKSIVKRGARYILIK